VIVNYRMLHNEVTNNYIMRDVWLKGETRRNPEHANDSNEFILNLIHVHRQLTDYHRIRVR
jgi:hypothetical protein